MTTDELIQKVIVSPDVRDQSSRWRQEAEASAAIVEKMVLEAREAQSEDAMIAVVRYLRPQFGSWKASAQTADHRPEFLITPYGRKTLYDASESLWRFMDYQDTTWSCFAEELKTHSYAAASHAEALYTTIAGMLPSDISNAEFFSIWGEFGGKKNIRSAMQLNVKDDAERRLCTDILTSEFGYTPLEASIEYTNFCGMVYDIQTNFFEWWECDLIPLLEVEGLSFEYLHRERGIKPPSVFTWWSELIRNRDKAYPYLTSMWSGRVPASEVPKDLEDDFPDEGK